MRSFELKGIAVIGYRLRLKSGLHVGGAKDTFEIGGVDSPVIKLPTPLKLGDRELLAGTPYLPGSSLKGKVRSLLEWFLKEPKGVADDGEEPPEMTSVEYMTKKYSGDEKKLGAPCDCGTCSICKLFGVGDVKTLDDLLKKNKVELLPGPPRAEFSDAYPTEESLKAVEEGLGEGIFTEIKYENRINRLTGTVAKGGLRNQERVPAGVEFEGEITVDLYDETDADLLEKLLIGLKLLETTYLGGSGSRGYGRVEFVNLKVTLLTRKVIEGGGNPTPLEEEPLKGLNLGQLKEKLKEHLSGQGE